MQPCAVCTWPTATAIWVAWRFRDGLGDPFAVCNGCRLLLLRHPPEGMWLVTAPSGDTAVMASKGMQVTAPGLSLAPARYPPRAPSRRCPSRPRVRPRSRSGEGRLGGPALAELRGEA